MVSLLVAPAAGQVPDVQSATAFLQELLADPSAAPEALVALRLTNDHDLAPIFVAMTRSAEKESRLFATASLSAVAGDDAAEPLLERLRSDTMMVVRAEAMAQLSELNALSVRDLREALDIEDETIQCMAARALVMEEHGSVASSTLNRLTESSEPMTACTARAALLNMGQRDQLDALRDTLADEDTPLILISLLLLQIEEEEIVEAVDLVREVASSDRPAELRLQAYKTLSSVSDRATNELVAALNPADRIVLRVGVLHLLADRPDGPARLERFTEGGDPVAVLAQLEVTRLGGGPRAAQAALEAVQTGHPIVINYLLSRAQEDIEAQGDRADFYTAALLDVISSARANADELASEHVRAARAAMLLGDLGTTEALEQLRGILGRPRDATVRAVATGLMQSKNPVVCNTMAPLLESPFTDLLVSAALTLGGHGDARANVALQKITNESTRYQAATVALASWYLIRNADKAPQTAATLAAGIR